MGEGDSSRKKDTSSVWATIGAVSEFALGIDITDIDHLEFPDNPLTDFNHEAWTNFRGWRAFAVFLYQATFVALLIYFIATSYKEGVSKSFISLDKTAGVCKDDKSSKVCCEVPQTITGTFLADTQGVWNTQNGFSYINNNYAITVAGLEYTNAQWEQVMKNITQQLSAIGQKGENRDLAWNMIAWSSFTAQNLERGFLQFYATGTAGVTFDKPIGAYGVASAASQTQECNLPMDVTYSASTTQLSVTIALCEDDECPTNPCPGILAPQAMGYDIYSPSGSDLELDISMQAVSTALAVNLGMIKLNHLVMIPGDNDRLTLLNTMVSAGAIDATTASHTSSYFDQRQAPSPPIYCHSANKPVPGSSTWESGDAFCLVRLGNILAYPVTTSYGWSADGTSYPTQCTKKAASVDGSAAKYYCNKFDMNVGLIYYPVDNYNTSYEWSFAPTNAPTANPTPGPGQPTIHPTARPSVRPTRMPTPGPTPLPGYPTIAPTVARTQRPTKKPSAAPTPAATEAPSAEPTAEPTDARRRLKDSHMNLGSRLTVHTNADDGDDAAGDDGGDDGAAYYDDYAGDGAYYYEGDGAYDDAADDAYATEGIGTYASPYYANAATDDFSPLIPTLADNGLIFNIGKYAAAQLNKPNSNNGDLFMPNNAYFAMVDTVVGTMGNKARGYKKDFKRLCSASVHSSIAEGCAMLAVNFDATDRRDISIYYYQPSSTPAFSNTLYVKNELIKLQKNTPTSLVQTYYSCVLAPWPAFLAAVGIGSSSAGAFLAVGFAVYVFLSLSLLNNFYGANIPSKNAMAKAEEAEAALKAAETEVARRVIDALRDDLLSGRANLPCVAAAFVASEAQLSEARAAAAEAGVEVPDVAGAVGATAPATKDVEVELSPMGARNKV